MEQVDLLKKQTTEKAMTCKYLGRDHKDTPVLTKLQNMYNVQSSTIFYTQFLQKVEGFSFHLFFKIYYCFFGLLIYFTYTRTKEWKWKTFRMSTTLLQLALIKFSTETAVVHSRNHPPIPIKYTQLFTLQPFVVYLWNYRYLS